MAERKCGTCREPGHTKRTCPVQVMQAENREMDKAVLVAQAEKLAIMEPLLPAPTVAEFLSDWTPEVVGALADSRPIYTGAEPGPWSEAQFPGICESCGKGFERGDTIRADGQGGYECDGCKQELTVALHDCDAEGHQRCSDYVTPLRDAPAAWERPTAANVALPMAPSGPAPMSLVQAAADVPAPDLFASPAPIIVAHAERDDDPLTARGRYLIKDPRTGEFNRNKNGSIKGFTRMTRLIEAASDTVGLNSWHKRNVVMGAALRPDLVAQAKGLTHADNKAQLDIVAELLAEAAGGSRGSANGTLIHKLTEKVDLGQISVHEVPEEFRQLVMDYRRELDRAGLVIVPELVERTVFLARFGEEIGGQFDRVYRHVATGTYVMGDVKTSKSLDLSWPKFEAQLWGYATAYNEFGTWDHAGKVWEPPKYRVRTDYGVVVHMPIEGPKPGLPPLPVSLQRTDMARGERWARLCADVRAGRSAGGKPQVWTTPMAARRDWDAEFSSVTDPAGAGRLWEQARAAGVQPLELQRLVQLAQSALRSMS